MTDLTVPQALEVARRLFGSVKEVGYPESLIQALQGVASFGMYAVVLYPRDDRPKFLHHNLLTVASPQVLDDYVSGTHVLDAVYAACRAGLESGLYRLMDLAPDAFAASEYYLSYDRHPCVSDEMGSLAEEVDFVARMPDGSYLVLALMRAKGDASFDAEEFANLTALEPVIRDTMGRHWLSTDPVTADTHPVGANPEMERAFFEFAKDRLSAREQEVVGLLLRGHSTLSVSNTLNIAEGTVKVHRKHIYEKLSINSQAQLFLMFCSHLLGH